MYFNAPKIAPLKDLKFFGGGWVSKPPVAEMAPEGFENLHWPLVIPADTSKIKLMDSGYGYMGPPYNAIEDFDYQLEKWGERYKN